MAFGGAIVGFGKAQCGFAGAGTHALFGVFDELFKVAHRIQAFGP